MRLLSLSILYTIGLFLCLITSWQLRFDFVVPFVFKETIIISSVWIVILKLILLAISRQYSGILTFFGVRDLARLFVAIAGSSVIILILRAIASSQIDYFPPRGVILIDFILSFMGLASIRLLIRLYLERSGETRNKEKILHVGIVGAGHTGANLIKELLARSRFGFKPKYVFDDNSSLVKSFLHGVPVVGKPEILLDSSFDHGIDKLIISLPSNSSVRIKEVVKIASQIGITCEIMPSTEELAAGHVRLSKLRKVQIQDLLRRNPVSLEENNIQSFIQGKIVMVTGAGGSIGSELCRQIANLNPQRLLLVEQCEVQLFSIEQELQENGFENIIVPYVCNILNKDRVESIFFYHKPEIVFHAAAHKHVSLMEKQPAEAYRNNTIGTVKMAEIAIKNGVSHFLFISTDKAIKPTSVMGATKRMAEIFLQSLYANNKTTKFMAVRFGNVLGSSGSVVPIFERQISGGGPVKVTHPEVTRYFMTIPEAVGLVLQSGVQSKGGEIFVLDMGDPVKIIDLAHQLIELHGHIPGETIDIDFVGLRPGEKLFEELSHKDENMMATNHPKIMKFISSPSDLDFVRNNFENLNKDLYKMNPSQIKLFIKQIVPEYSPYIR